MILTLPLGGSILFQTTTQTSLLPHGPLCLPRSGQGPRGPLYTYAKDRDKALQSLGLGSWTLLCLDSITVFSLHVQKCLMVIYPTSICWFQVKRKHPVVQICFNLGILD